MLTAKEEKALELIIMNPSAFNNDLLDFSKTWREQELEDGESWWSFADAESCGWEGSGKEWSGIISALVTKGLISTFDDEGINWVLISEDEFNNIKKQLS